MSETTANSLTPQRRSLIKRLLIVFACLVGFVIVLLAIAAFYTTTNDFQTRLRNIVVSELENATGGRVELKKIDFHLWTLGVEADGLVVHGLEGADQLPYLSAQRILIRVRINTFLNRAGKPKPGSRIGLNYLRVDKPEFHLIIDKDGKTNAPTPKHPSTSTEPVQSTLLDLQATRAEVADGLALINDKAIPLNVAANNLHAEVHYIAATDRYGATVDLGDLRTTMETKPEVQSQVHVAAELGRDVADLKKFVFTSGPKTKLTASGTLSHFAQPAWQVLATGTVDVKQVGYLAAVDGLDEGTIDLDAQGHSCLVAVAPVQKRHFLPRRPKQGATVAVKDPGTCNGAFFIGADAQLHDVTYRDASVRVRTVSGHARVEATPETLSIPKVVANFATGGGVAGSMVIKNWLGDPKVEGGASRTHIEVAVEKIPLRTVMDVAAPEHYGDLGFDTSITGPVTVDYGGPAKDVSTTVEVGAKLNLTPTGKVRQGALSNIPVSGDIDAHYSGARQIVNITQVLVRTPQTTLDTHGVLGVNKGDPLTNLDVSLQARDLGEFDQLLQTLGFEANGKKGSAALPVVLHGTLGFNGTAKGEARDLDVKGHLEADNLAVHLGSVADVHIDSVVADAEYSPYGGIAVASSTIKRGTAVLTALGSFKPHRVAVGRHGVAYNWDADGVMDATATLAQAKVEDLLEIAGQKDKVPLTGAVKMNAHAQGSLNDLHGTGNITLDNGTAYGENYQNVSVDVAAKGHEIDATQFTVRAHDMTVSGSGGYDLDTKHIQAQVAGNQLQLSRFDDFVKASPSLDGVLSLNATMNGTMDAPNLNAKIALNKVTVSGKPLGDVTATATSSGSMVNYELKSALVGAQVAATGQTSLTGDYQTQAKLTLSGLDAGTVVEIFAPGSIKASSNIAGTVTVNGPLAKPQQLAGTAEFQSLDLKLATVELKSVGPLRAHLENGTLTLDKLHINGEDTDLEADGSAVVLGDTNPQGGVLKANVSGYVNVAIAHSLDADIISSGKVTFKMTATGRVKKPSLSGDVNVENVNLAMNGIANGLSNMNGTLVFNEDRLDVKSLTAQTGGGQLKMGGYIAYQKGLFADLTATGDAVRVRLYGLSSTATANLRLQGSNGSLLLSGSVLVTRFGVGPDVDFSAFSSTGVDLPPSPDAFTNRIRMDVHVTSAPQLDFVNSYAKLAGSVDLTVRGTLATPTVLGRIQITEGKATFAGTTYELQRGSVTFSNPVRIDPVIDLDATARVETYDITIGLHGTAAALHPTYRSQPPLTEADIFNLLALGRTQEEAQSFQEQQTQQGADPTTNALLGGALNATVSSRVGKLFGAGSVKIDPTYVGTLGNSSARITVVEPISRQLSLTFATNVGQTAEQLISLAYQLTPNTSLVFTRDENDVYSLVYKIRKQYR